MCINRLASMVIACFKDSNRNSKSSWLLSCNWPTAVPVSFFEGTASTSLSLSRERASKKGWSKGVLPLSAGVQPHADGNGFHPSSVYSVYFVGSMTLYCISHAS